MADRFPLILNTNANQIQEIASGDQLDLTGNNIANAGIITASTVNVTGDLDVDGHINLDNISISGVTTFSGPIDLNSDLDVDGHTNLDNVSVSGVLTATTFSGDGSGLIGVASTDNIVTGTAATFNTYPVDINAGLTIAGVSTFTGALNIDSDIDVDGHTNLDNVSIAGVVTATTFVGDGDFFDLDVDGHTNLDNVSIAGVTTHSGSTTFDQNITFNGSSNGAVWIKSGDKFRLNNNSKVNFGSGDNMQIYHTGSAGYITNNTGLINIGSISGTTAAFSGNVSIGGTLTYEDVTNIDSVGLITARNGIDCNGDIDVDGHTNLDNVSVAGVTTFSDNIISRNITPDTDSNRFLGSNGVRFSKVFADVYEGSGANLTGISVGITTEALVKTHGQTASLDLSKDDHKVTATGTVTIDVTGGTEAGSHTLRIVNSGIATVGFSTYFLFPSGGAPNIPIASGTISLISFTVHRAGAVGVSTQLLSGASVSFA